MAEQQRATLAQNSFSPMQARAVVNRFLLSQVGSVFTAGTPDLDSAAHFWRVPILYNPPDFTEDEIQCRPAPSLARFNSIRQPLSCAHVQPNSMSVTRFRSAPPLYAQEKISRASRRVSAWCWRRMG